MSVEPAPSADARKYMSAKCLRIQRVLAAMASVITNGVCSHHVRCNVSATVLAGEQVFSAYFKPSTTIQISVA